MLFWAILVVVVIAIIFIVSLIFYIKTPAPKTARNAAKPNENCANCGNYGCMNKSKEEE